METKYLVTKDNIKLTYYKLEAEPEKEKIVIINAPGQSMTYWFPIINGLMETYNIYLLDYRGFPNYPDILEPEQISVQHHVKDLNLMLKEENIGEAYYICWCIGVKVGFEHFRTHKDLVKGMLILNPSYTVKPTDLIAQNLRMFKNRLDRNPNDIANMVKLIRNVGAVPSSDFIELASQEEDESPVINLYDIITDQSSFSNISFSLIDNRSGLYNYLAIALDLIDIPSLEDVQNFDKPLKVLYGEKDTITPIEDAHRQIYDKKDNIAYEIIDQASHYMGLEYPGKISKIMLDYFQGLK